MESTQPQPISTSECAPVNGKSATPFSQQRVVLTKQDYIRLKWEANYWRAQHACLVQREAALKAQVDMLEAQVRDLHQRLYGTKSEQSAGSEAAGQSKPASPRNRGQQPGTQGHPGPYSAHPASALPQNVRVSTGLRHCDGSVGTARDAEKPVGRIGVDHGVAGHILLWPPHPPLM